MKKEVSPKDFYLRNKKVYLKSFQTNLKVHFLINVCHVAITTQQATIPPAESGPGGKIPPFPGTNLIAGFVEFGPLMH